VAENLEIVSATVSDAAATVNTIITTAALEGGEVTVLTLPPTDPASSGFKREVVTLRIWTPPDFAPHSVCAKRTPVVFLNDGQNLFDAKLCMSGQSWEAAQTACELIDAGECAPFVIVGIDHMNDKRPLYYCPVKPGTGGFLTNPNAKDFRPEAKNWPGGEAFSYVDRVVEEIVPFVLDRLGIDHDPALLTFGGSSFGGICSLVMAMRHPGAFANHIVESPSFWMDNGRFLQQVLDFKGPWPQRMFLAMGSKEYTGTRGKTASAVVDKGLVDSYEIFLQHLQTQCGLEPWRIQAMLDSRPEAFAHTEKSWAVRLPDALRYFLRDPMLAATERRAVWTVPAQPEPGRPAMFYARRDRLPAFRETDGPLKLHPGWNNWSLGTAQDIELKELPGVPNVYSCRIEVPQDAWDMNFVFTDGHGNWDSNSGSEFRHRVDASRRLASQQGPATVEKAAEVARTHAGEMAKLKWDKTVFNMPEKPLPGAPATLYFNRAKSVLRHNPNIKAKVGFNEWDEGCGVRELVLSPTNLWRDEHTDWWAAGIDAVPEGATQLDVVFHDGCGTWDNNDGSDYMVLASNAASAEVRRIESMEVYDHAGGKLHICRLARKGNVNRRDRWMQERLLRVWTPAGFDVEHWKRDPKGIPVLYMNDGQNMFEDWIAHQGQAWNIGYAAAHLIGSKALPPFIIVGIDGAGPYRSYQYCPYPPGTGDGGFRGDCERWPGGGVDAYMRRVVQEVMPLITTEFGGSTDPDRLAFGGGSFGGVCALYAAMHYPHVFGSILAESPSLWIARGRFLSDLRNHAGPWAQRVFIGGGTLEFSATRPDCVRPDVDHLLLHYLREANDILRSKGLRGEQLRFQIDEGAGHHEGAWAYRLHGSLSYLLMPWWDV